MHNDCNKCGERLRAFKMDECLFIHCKTDECKIGLVRTIELNPKRARNQGKM